MNDFAAAIHEALDLCADSLSQNGRTRLADLLAMFADNPGDPRETAQLREASTLTCSNCRLSWPGFFLPMDMNGHGPMATLRLAVCPRCYSNTSVYLNKAPTPAQEATA
jgi:hypothetical protein